MDIRTCLLVHSLVQTLVQMDGNSPLCSIGHRPLRVRCPKEEKVRTRGRAGYELALVAIVLLSLSLSLYHQKAIKKSHRMSYLPVS